VAKATVHSRAGKERAGMKVRVVCYEGYKGGGKRPEPSCSGSAVSRWCASWTGGAGRTHEYVKLDGSDGARYISGMNRSLDAWEIPDDGIAATHGGQVNHHFLR